MKILRECLDSLSGAVLAPAWEAAVPRIDAERRHLQKLLARSDLSVYGANTLPGHRAEERVDDETAAAFQTALLRSHTIGGAPYFDTHEARCITYAKLYAWAAGHSGISLGIYQHTRKLATSASFLPQIPKGQTTSSGDVIPGSHWAMAVVNFGDGIEGGLQPGDAMAMMNGTFVHVGYTLSTIRKLRIVWSAFIELSILNAALSDANGSNLFHHIPSSRTWSRETMDYIVSRAGTPVEARHGQDPVSNRALPQVVELLGTNVEELLEELDNALRRPSANPMISEAFDFPLSQASFLATTLASRTSALVDGLLLAMWLVVGRTKNLLSGRVAGIATDAAGPSDRLGLIQYPKLMMSLLETARLTAGRRLYASGGDNSYGVEDLWTNGVSVTSQFDDVLDNLLQVLALERHVMGYVLQSSAVTCRASHDFLDEQGEGAPQGTPVQRLLARVDEGGLAGPLKRFPV